MEKTKREMLNLVEDLIIEKGFPKDIIVNTKRKIKSKYSNKTINYENEIILVFNSEKVKVNEVFYYKHVATVVNHINNLIEILKEENSTIKRGD